MIVYTYDIENENVFVSEHVCQPNPKRNGQYLCPAHYTEIAPPKRKENKNAFWSGTAWIVKDDFRGAGIYSTKSGDVVLCDTLAIPDGFTILQPGINQKWDGKKWADDPDKIKAATNSAAKAELIQIDAASIRSIREWITKQADCPKILKDHEAAARDERKKIKP